MNSIMEECEASTDVLQSQVDEARERSQRELDELRRQLQEKGAELEKSRQAANKLQDEVRRSIPPGGVFVFSPVLKHMLGLDKTRSKHLPPALVLLLWAELKPWSCWPDFMPFLLSPACSAASSGGGSAAVSKGAAGGPAEVQTTGEEGGGAGGEEHVRSGGERAPRQTPGGTRLLKLHTVHTLAASCANVPQLGPAASQTGTLSCLFCSTFLISKTQATSHNV